MGHRPDNLACQIPPVYVGHPCIHNIFRGGGEGSREMEVIFLDSVAPT